MSLPSPIPKNEDRVGAIICFTAVLGNVLIFLDRSQEFC